MLYPLVDVFIYSFEENFLFVSQEYTGIGFYNYKAKAENVAKINNPIQENIPTTVINNASNVVDVSYDNLNEQLKKAEEFRLDDNDESLKG